MSVNKIPDYACDSHIHIYDNKVASPQKNMHVESNGTVEDYCHVQTTIGTKRVVIVTPRPYGTNNTVTIDAIHQFGIENARGVAVLHPDVTDSELIIMHEKGIRGVRFSLYTATAAAVSFDMLEPMAERISSFGWHVQLHWTANQILEHKNLLKRLDTTIVFDHFARLPLPEGVKHPAYKVIQELADAGNIWIKLSAPYLTSTIGIKGNYLDVTPIAKAWVKQLPERTVWGSDWPHVTENIRPTDTALLGLLPTWIEDEAEMNRILVDNPCELYGFRSLDKQ